jgi:hypothetical protein
MTAFQYDFNVLPIGQQLWEMHLLIGFASPTSANLAVRTQRLRQQDRNTNAHLAVALEDPKPTSGPSRMPSMWRPIPMLVMAPIGARAPTSRCVGEGVLPPEKAVAVGPSPPSSRSWQARQRRRQLAAAQQALVVEGGPTAAQEPA